MGTVPVSREEESPRDGRHHSANILTRTGLARLEMVKMAHFMLHEFYHNFLKL